MSLLDKTLCEDVLSCIKFLLLYPKFASLADFKGIIVGRKVLYFYFFRLQMFNIVRVLIVNSRWPSTYLEYDSIFIVLSVCLAVAPKRICTHPLPPK